MDLSLFGIQGCGKGTHAKLLAAEFDYDIFGAGVELRKIAAQETEEGRLVKGIIDKGHLVPVEVTMKALSAWLARRKDRKIICDGIPRSMEQLEAFNGIMEESGRSIMGINIVISEDRALERIMKRASGRVDDATEESIRQRLRIFRETTMPVVEWYRARGQMVDVDGDAAVEVVYERLKEALAF